MERTSSWSSGKYNRVLPRREGSWGAWKGR